MTDTWVLDCMPPNAGTYDVTLHLTSRRGKHARACAVAHWPGRGSKRWDLLDMSVHDGIVVAWRPRPSPYTGPVTHGPLGIIMPVELGG